MDPPSPNSSEEDHIAGRRAREVYRYFRPEKLSPIVESVDSLSTEARSLEPSSRRSSTSSACGLSTSPHAIPASLPSKEPVWAPLERMPESLVLGSSNVTLTSFAQLAALRLGMDRVFISVSDRHSQYIIAQSAKSIEENENFEMDGGLYTGYPTLDIGSWKMCRDTVAMSTSNRETGSYQFLVSNDLSQDERYQNLSLVQEKPNFRFYVGTPLTTESNINVGCFFALDTKPRSEFTHKQREIMVHLSMLIMDYLKVSRQATEGRRAARLSYGLSCFVEGKSSFLEAYQSLGKDEFVHPAGMSPSTRSKTDHLSVDLHHFRSAQRSRSRSVSARSSSSVSDNKGEAYLPSSVDAPFPDWSSSGMQKHGDLYKGNSWTFQRAANLIRESLELRGDSGVVFVEANYDITPDNETSSDFSSSLETGKAAAVSAISTESNPFGPEIASSIAFPMMDLEEDFLHRVLRRYQKGKVWSFHRDGMLSSSDNEDSQRKSRARTRGSLGRPIGSKRRKTSENSMLNRFFPGATQVLFVPLWNAANSQWFGGCFCWNSVESNVFNPSVELSSLLGFGSSIMAECNRIESIISDRQKADFLGSISHELRSPLHGILAAAELLQSTKLDDFQGSLMETINACGQTLLDTMNQVLDYSKIISLEREFRHLQKRSTPSSDLKNMHHSATHLDAYVPTDLSILAEEVVEGVCVGHYRGQQSGDSLGQSARSAATKRVSKDTSNLQQDVDVVIDIAPHDWVYHTPPGALRRIIMNIFSNALKYTDHGRVSLRVEAKEAESRSQRGSHKEDLVTLTVSDTGKGISEEFLRGKLFVPFAQENSLATGTGLGLSIVRSLVKSLGGNININSRPGDGTKVQVTLPLMRSAREDCGEDLFGPSSAFDVEKVSIPSEARVFRDAHHGRKVAIWGFEPEEVSKHHSWAPLSNYLINWLGLDLVSLSSSAPVDIVLADRLPTAEEIDRSAAIRDAAFLILSDKCIGYNIAQAESSSVIKVVSIVNQPCGPHKLARAIQKCLGQTKVSGSNTNTTTALPARPRNETSASQEKPPPSMDMKLLGEEATKKKISEPSTVSLDPKPPFSEAHNYKTQPQTQNPRILIVEDNKINLNLMLAFLKKRELSMLDSAENGQLAVDAVKQSQQNYDIIFMDISMPVMNGFEATRAIRSLEKDGRNYLRPSVIIALTGLSSARDESEALESGIDLFLTKPVTLKSITKILNEWSEKVLTDQNRT
ncbi:uncharacterized protein N7459_000204 [Penicillium hispanicum]|uniref:uncharacterized protein n=1 Tax=Penicillium hispanicum TaxID=1080232 RepID=UPI0025404CBF|nr:uncharacterized protein N7459_000204 [Penicillium hispanicum]KAJ5593996.1 hypothetical protein N7459_000204 [Penicillium hispanicum]